MRIEFLSKSMRLACGWHVFQLTIFNFTIPLMFVINIQTVCYITGKFQSVQFNPEFFEGLFLLQDDVHERFVSTGILFHDFCKR